MKKKIIISIVSGIILIAGVFLILFKTDILKFKKEGLDTYGENIKFISNQNKKIYVYGEDVSFRDGINYNKISSLNEELNNDSFVVINDRQGNLSLSNDDYSKIKTEITKNTTIIYIGSSLLDEFYLQNLISEIPNEEITENGHKGVLFNNNKTDQCVGFWTSTEEDLYKTNSELFGEVISSMIVDVLKK